MSNLQVLQKMSQEHFLELLDMTFKCLTQKQPSDLSEQYKIFCNKSNLEISEFESTVQILLQCCKDTIKRGKPLNQLLDELAKLGMNENQTDAFSRQWEKSCASFIQTPADSTIPINPLIDMEWKFGVTSASSQLNTVGNVFLQMKLEVDEGSGRTKTVYFELQLSDFYAFLHEMERARASLDYLS